MHCDGCCCSKPATPSYSPYQLFLQAQFILSPDLLFSEKGAVSKIDYHYRFKHYKGFIVEHMATPGMEGLMTRLNRELFHKPIDDSSSPSPTQEQDSREDEDFSRAFNEATPGMLAMLMTFLSLILLTNSAVAPAINLPVTATPIKSPAVPSDPPSPTLKPPPDPGVESTAANKETKVTTNSNQRPVRATRSAVKDTVDIASGTKKGKARGGRGKS